jgi:peptidoglycan-associated lipoprotein
MIARSLCLAAVVTAASLAAGCEKKTAIAPPVTPLPAPPAETAAKTTAEPVPTADAAVDTGGLHVSDAIARACGLPRSDAAPKFDFDSATIPPQDRDLLAAIARCVMEGALRGRSLSLVGRADMRGEDEYNMSLGESRADTVQRYLHDLGVGRERLVATSRGKMDAKGTDDATMALDRRVDIELLATR